MLKHIEDNGDLNILINSSGAILLVCSVCKTMWTGTFSPRSSEAMALGGELERSSSGDTLTAALQDNPSLLDELGIDAEYLAQNLQE
jgi:hypothetical protein